MKKLILELLKEVVDKTIKCQNCGWSWKESTSELDDLYNCHKCGYDNKKHYLNESIVKNELNNIESDDLYDELIVKTNKLRKSNNEVSFGSADIFEVIYDEKTNDLIGASWIELSDVFSFHIIINPKYRKQGYAKKLIDGSMQKYTNMKKHRPDFKIQLNVVNDTLVDGLIKKYGLKVKSRSNNNTILVNENYNLRNKLRENLQLADKHYFKPGLLSDRVKNMIVNQITNGDNYTKIITDIYYYYLKHIDIYTDDDFINNKYWKEINGFYEQLKNYNKYLFPIKDLNMMGYSSDTNLYDIINALKYRNKNIELINKLPSIAKRNLKSEIRTERNGRGMHDYFNDLEYFTSLYSYLNNRNESLKDKVNKKMFKSNITIKDLISFAEDKENLLTGEDFTKEMLEELVEEDYDMDIIYNENNIMLIKVESPNAIKKIGCNSLWCFTYGEGFNQAYATWSKYSYNDIVYVLVDFDEDSNSETFMHVIIKPIEFDDLEDEEINDDKIFNMANDMVYNPLSVLKNTIGLDKAKELLTFDY